MPALMKLIFVSSILFRLLDCTVALGCKANKRQKLIHNPAAAGTKRKREKERKRKREREKEREREREEERKTERERGRGER